MQLYIDSTDTQFLYNFPYFQQVQCFFYQVHVPIPKKTPDLRTLHDAGFDISESQNSNRIIS